MQYTFEFLSLIISVPISVLYNEHTFIFFLSFVSRTKFYHAVAVLPQKVAAQILDLICTPPAGDPYEVLKDRLITLYSLIDDKQFEALVSLPLSGDQKPSHLMNQMLALLPNNYKPDFILRGLFLHRLLSDVCSHLLQENVSDPHALALKADKLFQSRVSSQVNLQQISSRIPSK